MKHLTCDGKHRIRCTIEVGDFSHDTNVQPTITKRFRNLTDEIGVLLAYRDSSGYGIWPVGLNGNGEEWEPGDFLVVWRLFSDYIARNEDLAQPFRELAANVVAAIQNIVLDMRPPASNKIQ